MTTPEVNQNPSIEAKPSEQPQAAPAAQPAAAPAVEQPKAAEPVVYDLKAPENSNLSADAIEKVTALAKEKGLSNEQAQLLLNRENDAINTFKSSQEESYKSVVSGWAQQVQTDPEMGGERFNETAEGARRALKQFASPEFVKLLETTGFGNHPELVRTFSRINKQMANDKFVRGNEPASEQKSRAQKIYGGN